MTHKARFPIHYLRKSKFLSPHLTSPNRSPRDEKPSAASRTDKPPAPKLKWDLTQFPVKPSEGKTRFHDLDLPIEIIHGIADLEFQYCTPIQASILPQALTGVDVTGKAQTGTGKSAAFLITILSHLFTNPLRGKRQPGTPRALILVPTRELALQVRKDANALGHDYPAIALRQGGKSRDLLTGHSIARSKAAKISLKRLSISGRCVP